MLEIPMPRSDLIRAKANPCTAKAKDLVFITEAKIKEFI